MTTLFSSCHALFVRRTGCVVWTAACLFVIVHRAPGEKIAGIGYVVSPQDRARADAAYQEGFAAYQASDYPKALGLIAEADRLKPDQPDGWNLRGMVFLRQKNYDQARTAFAHAVALDPMLWAAQFNLAEASFQQKDYPRARKTFDKLLGQTDRFKQGNRWELVQYKVFLCLLLGGDVKGADARLARLPVKGGATPARLYAEAARAYRGKQGALAQKSLASAQAAFPAQVTDLFADSLVQAGWQTPTPASMPTELLAGPGLPVGVTLATTPAAGMTKPMPYYAVDPRVEAAAAEPLPLPDAGPHPIVGKLTPALQTEPVGNTPAPTQKPPAAAMVAAQVPPPQATPDVELEHTGLLLIE